MTVVVFYLMEIYIWHSFFVAGLAFSKFKKNRNYFWAFVDSFAFGLSWWFWWFKFKHNFTRKENKK